MIYASGASLSRVPCGEDFDEKVIDVQTPSIEFEDVILGYDNDQFFSPFFKALQDEWTEDLRLELKLKKFF